MSDDVLSTLPAVSFRGIIFPVESFSDQSTNQASELTPLQGKGSYIDITARKSSNFSLTVPLYSPLATGQNENADFSNLFQETLPKLMAAMEDPSAGPLVHPIRGEITVKPLSYSYAISSTVRNGTTLQLEFAEHIEPASASKELSALNTFRSAVFSLETQYGDQIRALMALQGDPLEGATLEDWANAITGFVGSVELAADKIKGKIDNTLYQVERVSMAVDRAEQSLQELASRSPLPADPVLALSLGLANASGSSLPFPAAAIREQLERIRDACFRLGAKAAGPGKLTKKHVVLTNQSLLQVSRETRTSVSDLVLLNPSLRSLKYGIVKANTLLDVYRNGSL